jgi:hypothetical protein
VHGLWLSTTCKLARAKWARVGNLTATGGTWPYSPVPANVVLRSRVELRRVDDLRILGRRLVSQLVVAGSMIGADSTAIVLDFLDLKRRPPNGNLNHGPVRESSRYRRGAVGDIQSAIDVLQVRAYGSLGHTQLAGNLELTVADRHEWGTHTRVIPAVPVDLISAERGPFSRIPVRIRTGATTRHSPDAPVRRIHGRPHSPLPAPGAAGRGRRRPARFASGASDPTARWCTPLRISSRHGC